MSVDQELATAKTEEAAASQKSINDNSANASSTTALVPPPEATSAMASDSRFQLDNDFIPLSAIVDTVEDFELDVHGNILKAKALTWKEDFKKFAFKGPVVDLAVATILGAAFSAVITSLSNDIILPILGILAGSNWEHLFVVLRKGKTSGLVYETIDQAADDGAVTWNYGRFLTTLVVFIEIALILFVFVRIIQKGKRTSLLTAAKQQAAVLNTCPYCYTKIDPRCSRCPACTSKLLPTPTKAA